MTAHADRIRAYVEEASNAYEHATPTPRGFEIDEFPGASLYLPDVLALLAERDRLAAIYDHVLGYVQATASTTDHSTLLAILKGPIA